MIKRIIFWIASIALIVSVVIIIIGFYKMLFESLVKNQNDLKNLWYMLAFMPLIISSWVIQIIVQPRG